MKKAINAARKAAGLPPESEAEEAARKADVEKMNGCANQMQEVGCWLTAVGLLILFVFLLL